MQYSVGLPVETSDYRVDTKPRKRLHSDNELSKLHTEKIFETFRRVKVR